MDEGTRRRIADSLRTSRRQQLDDLRSQIAKLKADMRGHNSQQYAALLALAERVKALEKEAQALLQALRADETTVLRLPVLPDDTPPTGAAR